MLDLNCELKSTNEVIQLWIQQGSFSALFNATVTYYGHMDELTTSDIGIYRNIRIESLISID
jgi:hypothetical protein